MALLYWLYQRPLILALAFTLLAVWDLVWKGISMWYASRNKQKGWFITLLILNTAGLLPIVYLVWFKPKKKDFVIAKKEESKKK